MNLTQTWRAFLRRPDEAEPRGLAFPRGPWERGDLSRSERRQSQYRNGYNGRRAALSPPDAVSAPPSNSPAMSRLHLISTLALLACFSPCAWGDEKPLTPEQEQFFEKSVRPVLVANCFECHADK